MSDIVDLAAEQFACGLNEDRTSEVNSESDVSDEEEEQHDAPVASSSDASETNAIGVSERILAARKRIEDALEMLVGVSQEHAAEEQPKALVPEAQAPSPDRIAEAVADMLSRARSDAKACVERSERFASEAQRAAAEAEAEAREALERLGRLQERQLERCVREQVLVEFWTGK